MSGSTKAHDLDTFLGHKPRAGGTRELRNWKNRDTKPLPRVDVVLHTQAKIVSIWQNSWPRVVERDRDGAKTREVWSGKFNSWESEEVLQKAYRIDEDGRPELPADICPMAKLIEIVRYLVVDGQLPWYTPLFKFKASDSDKNLTLHAAGIYNGIKDQRERLAAMIENGGEAAKLAAKEQQAAKNAGAPPTKEAWKQNMMAKCNYIFTVVDNDNPKDGIQIATETTAVGAAVQDVIRDAITAHEDNPKLGNPLLHPYVIRWSYDKNALMSGKYKAVKMETKISDEVMELVTEKAPPSIDKLTRRGNIAELRASMEEHYVGPEGLINFDEIFADAEELNTQAELEGGESNEPQTGDAEDEEVDSESMDTAVEERAVEKVVSNAGQKTGKTEKAKAFVKSATRYDVAKVEEGDDGLEHYYADDGAELFGCDECGEATRSDEQKCSHCGVKLKVIEQPQAAEDQPDAEVRKPKLPGRGTGAKSAGTLATGEKKQSAKNRVRF